MNKVKFNLKNVHWALATTGGYTTVHAMPGAVSLTLDPQSEEYTFFADGERYFEYTTNNGYEGDLEMAIVPDEFKKAVLGEIEDGNGNMIELDEVEVQNFALGFQIDGDVKETPYWFYNCKAARTPISAQTKEENIEAQTETMTFSNKPDPRISVGKFHPVKIKRGDASTQSVTEWFAAVQMPAVTTA